MGTAWAKARWWDGSVCHLANIEGLDSWKGRQHCKEPLSSLLWGSGKSQEGFLVLAQLLDLQGRDGETQVSCPDHTLVTGQGCDRLRLCSVWVVLRSSTVPSQTEEGQVGRGAVPEAGTTTTATVGDEKKTMFGLLQATPCFSAFGAWGWDLAEVHIHTWHV